MVQRKVRSVNKALTDEERVRHRTIREQVEQEKTELMARGRRAKARSGTTGASLRRSLVRQDALERLGEAFGYPAGATSGPDRRR